MRLLKKCHCEARSAEAIPILEIASRFASLAAKGFTSVARNDAIIGFFRNIFIISGFWFLVTGYYVHAEPISSKELIENAKSLDGQKVIYKGELVTAILSRGEDSWINLNDGTNAIGIWCRSAKLDSVKYIGDYKRRGDVLEAEGIFHRACAIHGGELDIHADDIRIVEQGRPLEEHLDKQKLYISIGIFLTVLSIIIIFRKRL